MRARPRSVVTYRWAFDDYIAPQLGDVEMRHLRTPPIRKFLNGLTRQGMAPRSVGIVRTVLHQILDQAVEDNLFEYNPCDSVKPPKVEKQKAP